MLKALRGTLHVLGPPPWLWGIIYGPLKGPGGALKGPGGAGGLYMAMGCPTWPQRAVDLLPTKSLEITTSKHS